jgi:hypothetical protein
MDSGARRAIIERAQMLAATRANASTAERRLYFSSQHFSSVWLHERMARATHARSSVKYRQGVGVEQVRGEHREPFRRISNRLKAIAQPDFAANNFTGNFAGP